MVVCCSELTTCRFIIEGSPVRNSTVLHFILYFSWLSTTHCCRTSAANYIDKLKLNYTFFSKGINSLAKEGLASFCY